LTTRDTVIGETPAWAATSSMVMAPPFRRTDLIDFSMLLCLLRLPGAIEVLRTTGDAVAASVAHGDASNEHRYVAQLARAWNRGYMSILDEPPWKRFHFPARLPTERGLDEATYGIAALHGDKHRGA
jgi:hypothetical protein